MASEWYAVIDGQQAGPYTTAQLKDLKQEGTVHQDTPVWCDGMTEWQPYSSVADSLEQSVETKAPLPTGTGGTFSPSQTDADASPYAAPKADLGTEPEATSFNSNSPYGPYQDPTKVSNIVRGLLIGCLVVTALEITVLVMHLNVLYNSQNGLYSQAEYNDAVTDIEEKMGMVTGIGILITISCGLAWAFWTNRVMKNSWAINSLAMDTSPGWAVGWYFVPVASLWKPFHALKEAWEVTIPNAGGLIGTWWAFYLLTRFFGVFFRIYLGESYSVEEVIRVTYASIADYGINFVSIIIALLMATKLTKSQVAYAAAAKAG